MVRYIDYLDEAFVINFVKSYLENKNYEEHEREYNAKLTKNGWEVNIKCDILSTDYKIILSDFDTLFQGLTSNALNLKWRVALTKKFGIDNYYEDLQDVLISRYLRKVRDEKDKLYGDLKVIKSLAEKENER